MLNGKPPARKSPAELGESIEHLLEFWGPAFAKLDWDRRTQLLEQIDEEIQKDWRYGPESGPASRLFTERMIGYLGRCAITCRAQADFYYNSRNEIDCAAAHGWYQRNIPADGAADAVVAEPDDGQARHSDREGGPLAT